VRWWERNWRRGKGFEPSGGVATATGKPAAALANGDLSETKACTSKLIFDLTKLKAGNLSLFSLKISDI